MLLPYAIPFNVELLPKSLFSHESPSSEVTIVPESQTAIN